MNDFLPCLIKIVGLRMHSSAKVSTVKFSVIIIPVFGVTFILKLRWISFISRNYLHNVNLMSSNLLMLVIGLLG